jgi:hypothetical protein
VLKQFAIGTALLAGLACAGVAHAQTQPLPSPPAAAEAPKPDYADPKAWLCRPGAHDACDIDETTTVVAANGTLTKETWKADPNAPIDCFYVYPTVSTDPGQNSDMTADPAEINVVKQQFARFAQVSSVCADGRQITLVGLRKALAAPGAALAWGEGAQMTTCETRELLPEERQQGRASCWWRTRRVVHPHRPDQARDRRKPIQSKLCRPS